MKETDRARALLEREFKKLNDRLEKVDDNPAGEGKYSVKAYTEGVTQINAALLAVCEYGIRGGDANGIWIKQTERGGDAAS